MDNGINLPGHKGQWEEAGDPFCALDMSIRSI